MRTMWVEGALQQSRNPKIALAALGFGQYGIREGISEIYVNPKPKLPVSPSQVAGDLDSNSSRFGNIQRLAENPIKDDKGMIWSKCHLEEPSMSKYEQMLAP